MYRHFEDCFRIAYNADLTTRLAGKYRRLAVTQGDRDIRSLTPTVRIAVADYTDSIPYMAKSTAVMVGHGDGMLTPTTLAAADALRTPAERTSGFAPVSLWRLFHRNGLLESGEFLPRLLEEFGIRIGMGPQSEEVLICLDGGGALIFDGKSPP